jgi:hypothetical protein
VREDCGHAWESKPLDVVVDTQMKAAAVCRTTMALAAAVRQGGLIRVPPLADHLAAASGAFDRVAAGLEDC